MPIYEYQCSNCSHAFELIQKVNDEVAKKCEQCGQETAIRLVSAPGFQLKGTGWYATDFKDKPKSKPLDSSDSKPSEQKKSESNSTVENKVEKTAPDASSTPKASQGESA